LIKTVFTFTLLISTPVLAQETSIWIDARGSACEQLCPKHNRYPVRDDAKGSPKKVYTCSATSGNVVGSIAENGNSCLLAVGAATTASYRCLCDEKAR
jgi:hypothetical protein